MRADERTAGDLAGTIAQRRKALRLSQRDLADLSGVSVRLIGQVEQGKQTLRLDRLTSLLTALGLELRIATRGTVDDG